MKEKWRESWGRRALDALERAGNRLPHPATLFAAGTLVVLGLSQIAAALGWSVRAPAGAADERLEAVGLLSGDGLWWLLSSMVDNFVTFPPLGIVLVGMLGIGLAEHSGLLPALITRAMRVVPTRLLTPAVVLVGILSSLAMDAGYVVLPPLAAALYLALGRPPVAGIAAAFAGVSAGFSANLSITGLDPLLAGFTQAGAQLVDPGYQVAVTANWWFMIASTVLLTLAGWYVTDRIVEPRLRAGGVTGAGAVAATEVPDEPEAEASGRGLAAAGWTFAGFAVVTAALVLIPGAPLAGEGARFPRWIEAAVPLLFLGFVLPGLAYGIAAGTIRDDKDAARMLSDTIVRLAPYIVMAFFAAQFVESFRESNLGAMLAVTGGQALAAADWPPFLLTAMLVVVVAGGNLLVGSASAKYAFFAPVFVPMLMQVGISPELTQAAYRVGDSVTNVIAPLNPYLVIILGFLQRYVAGSGIGTLVAVMLPYTLVFGVVWLAALGVWLALGWDLGPGGPLYYGG